MFRDENAKVLGKARDYKKGQRTPSPSVGEAETQAGSPKQFSKTPSPSEREPDSQSGSPNQIQKTLTLPYVERYGGTLLDTVFLPVPTSSDEEPEEGDAIAIRSCHQQGQNDFKIIPAYDASLTLLPQHCSYPFPYNQLSTEDIGVKFFMKNCYVFF